MADRLSLTHYGPEVITEEEEAIVSIYEKSHADVIDDPFYSADRSWNGYELTPNPPDSSAY